MSPLAKGQNSRSEGGGGDGGGCEGGCGDGGRGDSGGAEGGGGEGGGGDGGGGEGEPYLAMCVSILCANSHMRVAVHTLTSCPHTIQGELLGI
eukprot:CAMPEP_0174699840 /NCGR_PEP_ID=MMETSP1094-20130205/4992_1 /TAXON_ID=156173 /ORGANISM="Chrysochromulina brevifilum, Strain UTEX LB 985" /LENGTH=92 /DNA_ID=CAMNT_0015897243 /DNA_START=19 /DNA_END=297 /DNA_ORIENTATION=-